MAADWSRKHIGVVPRSRCSTRLDTPATPSSITVWLTLASTYYRSPIQYRRLAGRCAKCSNHRRPIWFEELGRWAEEWDNLTRDEKADPAHMENRQLRNLLNQLADRIVAPEINVENPIRAAIGGGSSAKLMRLFQYRVEDWSEVAGRGVDDLQDLGGGGLPLQGFA